MAEVYFKAPCVAPGCHYRGQTPAGETEHIPDWWVAEIDPKCMVVINPTSEVKPEPPPQPENLLRSHDWIRTATEEEDAEVVKLRASEQKTDEPEAVQPVTRRRANVIPGSKA